MWFSHFEYKPHKSLMLCYLSLKYVVYFALLLLTVHIMWVKVHFEGSWLLRVLFCYYKTDRKLSKFLQVESKYGLFVGFCAYHMIEKKDCENE